MDDEAVQFLLNYALDHSISFESVPGLKPDTPSFAITDKRFIVLNMNWHNKRELPFQVAHEIGHVLNNHPGVLYYSSPASNTKIEAEANSTAVDLLIDYCKSIDLYHMDVYKFMDRFAIPNSVKTSVIDKLENNIIY